MSSEAGLRRGLWILAGATFVGTAAELALIGHRESLVQGLPFVLCGIGAVAAGLGALQPRVGPLWAVRTVAGFVLLGATFGIWEHLEHNHAFAAEIQPNATTSELLVLALTGASPLLAPGALGVGGALLALASWRHPAFTPR